MSDRTEINEFLDNNRKDSKTTEINPDVYNEHKYDSKATEINEEILYMSSLIGKTILGKYTITRKISSNTGEADVYVCEFSGNEYVFKIYRRVNAIKREVINRVMKVDSPYVTKIIDYGEYNGLTFVILPYYKNGSLEGKNYSLKIIEEIIVPDVNEGLHALHEVGIVHKDIKPSNIMIWNNHKGVSIIDFGISSALEIKQSYVVTKTGFAPAYTDPESINTGLFFKENDYYSLGITIYALFCGHAPYENMSADDIARYKTIQNLPFPSSMPDRLVKLITGLTYRNIPNRHNMGTVNRRWTYSEVKRFLNGENVPVPDYGFAGYQPYIFLNKSYSSLEDLTVALGENWEAGKQQLYRGLLSGYLKPLNPQLAGYCLDAEESHDDSDKVFFNLLFKLNPNLKNFYWQNRSYPSLEAFGKDLLNKLWNNDKTIHGFADSVLTLGIVSDYLRNTNNQNMKIRQAVAALENQYKTLNNQNYNNALKSYYSLAYMISDERVLNINGKKFKTISELVSYLNLLVSYSYERFVNFTNLITNKSNDLNPQFEAWLIAIGKRDELTKWFNSIK